MDFLLDEDFEDLYIRSNKTYPDTHLNNPIRTFVHKAALVGERSYVGKAAYQEAVRELEQMKSLMSSYLSIAPGSVPLSHDHTSLIRWILSADPAVRNKSFFTFVWSTMMLDITDSFEVANLSLLTVLPFSPCPSDALIAVVTRDRFLFESLFYWQRIFEDLIYIQGALTTGVELNKTDGTLNFFEYAHDNHSQAVIVKLHYFDIILREKSYAAVSSDRQQAVFGNRDALLMTASMLSERCNLYLTSLVAEAYGMEGYLSPLQCNRILWWGDQLLASCKEHAYDVLKNYEALVVGVILSQTQEKLCDNEEFLRAVKKDIFKSKLDQGILRDSVSGLIEVLISMSKAQRAQAFGLYRIWGHPAIETLAGIHKVKQITQNPKVIDQTVCQNLVYKFKEVFFRNYYARFHRFPTHEYTGLSETYLKNRLETHQDVETQNSTYRLQDWEFVKILPCLPIETLFDINSLLSDKALSPTKSLLVKHLKDPKKRIPIDEKRVVLSWMKSNYSKVPEFLKSISEEGFSEEDLLVGVCPKEREMKIEPRLFALLTLRARIYFVLTEKMLADHVIPLFPEITMTDNHTQLQLKLKQVVDPMSYDRSLTASCVINIDFDKWNSNMRDNLVRPFFQEIDRLFGLDNVFARTHQFFSDSVIYLTDQTIDIQVSKNGDIEDGPAVWRNHMGGFEGLRQKGWTLLTTIILLTVLERSSASHRLLGQGDNQVIVMIYPKPKDIFDEAREWEYVRGLHHDFLSNLNTLLGTVGLPLKTQETWSSTYLFMYGKDIFLQGVPLSMSQKKLCRVFPQANEQFPTLENTISSIYSNGNSASLADVSPVLAFCVSTYHAVRTFRLHLFYSPLLGIGLLENLFTHNGRWSVNVVDHDQNGKPIEATRRLETRTIPSDLMRIININKQNLPKYMMFLPKVLGGYPVQCASNFLMRGFPDTLTEWCASNLKLLTLELQDPIMKTVIENTLRPEYSPYVNAELLIEDPVSVNVLMPTSSAGIVKKQVEDWMSNHAEIRNEYFKEMMMLAKRNPELCFKLASPSKLWPRLFHDIHQATVEGYSNKFVSKVISTTTVVRQTASVSGDRLNSVIKRSEGRYSISVFYKLFTPGEALKSKCSIELSRHMRNHGWQREIVGVATPHPIEVFSRHFVVGEGCDYCLTHPGAGYILFKISDALRNDNHAFINTIGHCVPYLGSSTREKVPSYKYSNVEESSPLAVSAIRLLRTVGWFVDGHIANLLDRLVKSFVDVDTDMFKTPFEAKTGSGEHRYHDRATKHGGYLQIKYNAATFIQPVTSNLVEYNKGRGNVTLHFQAIMCCGISEIASLASLNKWPKSAGSYHFHLDCPTCIMPVDESLVTGSEVLDTIVFPDLKGNRILASELATSSAKLSKIPRKELIINKDSCYTGVSYFISRIIIDSRYRASHGLEERHEVTPNVWAVRLNPIEVFERVAVLLYLYWNSFPASLRDNKKASFLNWLQRYDRVYLEPLCIFFCYRAPREALSNSKYMIIPPSSIPSTLASQQASALNGLSLIVEHKDFTSLITQYNHMISMWFPLISSPILWCRYFIGYQNVCFVSFSSKELEFINETIIKVRHRNQDEELSVELLMTALKEDEEQSLAFMSKIQTCEFYESRASADFLVKSLPDPDYAVNSEQCTLVSYHGLPQASSPFYFPSHLKGNQSPSLDHDIMREVHPLPAFQYHFYKPAAVYTSAHYKLLSVFQYVQPETNLTGLALSLGDGTGGNTLLLLRLFGQLDIFYNSLIDIAQTAPQSLTECYPPALDCYSGWESRIVRLDLTLEGVSDVSDPVFVDHIARIMTKRGDSIPLIVGDMEGQFWADDVKFFQFVNNILRIWHHLSDDILWINKFYVNRVSIIDHIVCHLSQLFKNVFILRSFFSTPGTLEFYLIIRGKYPQVTVPFQLSADLFAPKQFPSLGYNVLWSYFYQATDHKAFCPSMAVSKAYSKRLAIVRHVNSMTSRARNLLTAVGIGVWDPICHPETHDVAYKAAGIFKMPYMIRHEYNTVAFDSSLINSRLWKCVYAWCAYLCERATNDIVVISIIKTICNAHMICYKAQDKKNYLFPATINSLPKVGYHPNCEAFCRDMRDASERGKWTKLIPKYISFLLKGEDNPRGRIDKEVTSVLISSVIKEDLILLDGGILKLRVPTPRGFVI